MIRHTTEITMHTSKKHASDVLVVAKQQKMVDSAYSQNSWNRTVVRQAFVNGQIYSLKCISKIKKKYNTNNEKVKIFSDTIIWINARHLFHRRGLFMKQIRQRAELDSFFSNHVQIICWPNLMKHIIVTQRD